MHGPSFAVADPYIGGGFDDMTNSCVKHVVQSGFSPEKCLLFDHMHRREALKGLSYYPENIRDIHEQFTWALRDNMRAVVEICWGQPVKERMMSRLRKHLSPIALWGPYKGVSIWLEWAVTDTEHVQARLVRFVIFVHHPQAILQKHRAIDARVQDLHLRVAMLLAGIPVEDDIYKPGDERNKWHNLNRKQLQLHHQLSATAIREVLTACPQYIGYFFACGGKLSCLTVSDLETITDDAYRKAARLAGPRAGPAKIPREAPHSALLANASPAHQTAVLAKQSRAPKPAPAPQTAVLAKQSRAPKPAPATQTAVLEKPTRASQPAPAPQTAVLAKTPQPAPAPQTSILAKPSRAAQPAPLVDSPSASKTIITGYIRPQTPANVPLKATQQDYQLVAPNQRPREIIFAATTQLDDHDVPLEALPTKWRRSNTELKWQKPNEKAHVKTPLAAAKRKPLQTQSKSVNRRPRPYNAQFRNAFQAMHERCQNGKKFAQEDAGDEEAVHDESVSACTHYLDTGKDLDEDNKNEDYVENKSDDENDGESDSEIDGEDDNITPRSKTLKSLVRSLLSTGASPIDIITIYSLYATKARNLILCEWEDVPSEMRRWLPSQPGLRIDGKPIDSTGTMLAAHQLLCRKAVPARNLDNCDIIDIAFDIVQRYYRNVEGLAWNTERDSRIKNLMVDGTPPNDVMPRKCPICQERILDDAHARYKKLDPTRYIVRQHGNGCGRVNCKGSSTIIQGIPADGSIPHTTATMGCLSHTPAKPAGWRDFFVLENPGALSLPEKVEITCKKCGKETRTDDKPQWTKDEPPRYIIPKPRCQSCKSKNVYWQPVDKELASIDAINLTKMFARTKSKQ